MPGHHSTADSGGSATHASAGDVPECLPGLYRDETPPRNTRSRSVVPRALRPGHVMCHQPGPGTGRLPRPPPCPDARRARQRQAMADRLVLVRDLGHARTLPTWRTRLLTVHDPGRQLRRGRVVRFVGTGATSSRTSPSVSMRLISPYSAAVSSPPVRNQVAPGASHSSTSSNSARTRSLATPRILSSYTRGRFVLTSPGLSLCVALTPTVGCGVVSGHHPGPPAAG